MTGRTKAMQDAMAEALATGRTVVYASRGDDGRLHLEHIGPDDVRRAMERSLESLTATYAALVEQLRPAWEQTARAIGQVHDHLVQAGAVPEQPPTDPAARALHARRHRNTGPAVHADPRRNRR